MLEDTVDEAVYEFNELQLQVPDLSRPCICQVR